MRPHAPHILVEFNPNNFIGIGCKIAWEALEEVLGDNFDDFINNAIITRLDLAFDVNNLSPDGINAFVSKAIKQRPITGARGEIETLYFGAWGSDFQVCIYDKSKESNNQKHKITRFEFRLKPRITLCNLHKLTFPHH